MRHFKLSNLFTFGKNIARRENIDFRLNIVCSRPVVSALRKQLFWEMHELGLKAQQVTVTPAADAEQACLSVKLDCPGHLRQAFNEMALRFVREPNIHHVHWGRRKDARRVATPPLFAAARA